MDVRICIPLISGVLLSATFAEIPSTNPPPPILDYSQPPRVRPSVSQPVAKVRVELSGGPAGTGGWIKDPEISWYGPGFYGRRTACGQRLTRDLLGVAHRTMPCGSLVEFRWHNRSVTVPVVDRGPYVDGRQWDLTGGTCVYLEHCFTGPIEYRLVRN